MDTRTIDPRLGVKDLAAALRVSPTYIKSHAKELGGVKVDGQWMFSLDASREKLLEIWPW